MCIVVDVDVAVILIVIEVQNEIARKEWEQMQLSTLEYMSTVTT